MGFLCKMRGHRPVARGVRNSDREFGRCDRCRCDLMRDGSDWKAVPKGYKVVWRPRTGNEVADRSAGAAAVGREVTIKGVVVGERCYGSQRFALVRLNADDDRSYRDAVDKVGTSGGVALQMESRARATLFERQASAPAPQAPSLSDIVARDPYRWDDFDQSPEKTSRAPSLMLRSAVV